MEIEKAPPHIAAGQLFRAIEQLPSDQRELVFAQSQSERERIMALSADVRSKAIDALRPKPAEAPLAPLNDLPADTAADPVTKPKGK